jgi:hypothetical protein
MGSLYTIGLSDWTAVKMGPKRDVIGDLARAVRAEGALWDVFASRGATSSLMADAWLIGCQRSSSRRSTVGACVAAGSEAGVDE